jgi:NSS family neurotransmitter:Na+ symporter
MGRVAVSERDGQWRSASGFVLAALGSAVGLGNVWRFSYVAGENGGGAFLFAYLVAVLALGIPLLIAELAIGRSARADAVAAFARVTPDMPWRWAGWPGVAACITILAYYPTIAGWVANYLWRFIVQGVDAPGTMDHAAQFREMLSNPVQAMGWQAFVLATGAAVVALGVAQGIERASRILMPVFAMLLLLLALHGLTLDGAGQALRFLFRPEWSALLETRTWLAAIGQAFFSMGLAMGILVAYGGYLPASQRLVPMTLAVAAGDTAVSLVAGLMIFPAVFTYGFDPAQGTTLVFAVLPEVFAAMPLGHAVAVLFFLLLLIAALTSVMALLEVPVSILLARLGWARWRAAAFVAVAAFLLGLPAALDAWMPRGWLAGDRPVLDRLDLLASDILLPLSGIAIAIVAGWRWNRAEALRATGITSPRTAALWLWSLRVALPTAIALTMVRGLGLL